MVKITNGIAVFEVPRGAYDSIYSKQGYRLLEAERSAFEQQDPPAKSEDEAFLETIVEKPVSQWSKDEIKRFAALRDIDISDTKSANEAKVLIKEYLEAQSSMV